MGANRRTAGAGTRDAIVNKVVASPVVPTALRWRFLRATGQDVAPSTIGSNVSFGGRDISIGENVWFGDDAPIYVADGVRVGAGVRVLTRPDTSGETSVESSARPVLIGQGAQIGSDTVVQPGVTIGEGAVIAPNSVVSERVTSDPDAQWIRVPTRASLAGTPSTACVAVRQWC